MVRLTPSEQRIYDALADGGSHPKEELQKLLCDDLSENGVYIQVSNIRSKVRPIGQDIISERWYNGVRYRRVRIVTTGE